MKTFNYYKTIRNFDEVENKEVIITFKQYKNTVLFLEDEKELINHFNVNTIDNYKLKEIEEEAKKVRSKTKEEKKLIIGNGRALFLDDYREIEEDDDYILTNEAEDWKRLLLIIEEVQRMEDIDKKIRDYYLSLEQNKKNTEEVL